MTGPWVHQILEPAFSNMPAAVGIASLLKAALLSSGTSPFAVPDVFYECHKMQNVDTKYYLAPVYKTGAIAFMSGIPAVSLKEFRIGPERLQAGLFWRVWWFYFCVLLVWVV